MINYITKDSENWIELNGISFQERSDIITNIYERNIIEARYKWATSRMQKHGIKDVLDLGCGLGYGTELIYKSGFNVEGLDKSEIAVKICSQRYPDINFIHCEFPNCVFTIHHKFDAIIANEVIEHVENYKLFLSSCFDLLKDGGLLLLTTPNRKYTGERNPHHVHEFTSKEIKEILPDSKVRAFSSHLIRGRRLLLFFMNKERLQRFVFFCSRLPPIYYLPKYAYYFLIEVVKK